MIIVTCHDPTLQPYLDILEKDLNDKLYKASMELAVYGSCITDPEFNLILESPYKNISGRSVNDQRRS